MKMILNKALKCSKKINFFSLVVFLFVCCVISGCVSHDKTTIEFEGFANQIFEVSDFEEVREMFTQIKNEDDFEGNIINVMNEFEKTGNLKDSYRIIEMLDYFEYESELIKKQFESCLKTEQENVIHSNSAEVLDKYTELVLQMYSDYYVDRTLLHPYEMKELIINTCTKAIGLNGQGGYYDTNPSHVKDQHYWWSPLFEKSQNYGEAGYQEVTIQNFPSGDFNAIVQSKVFYKTKPSDEGNSLKGYLYYKGQFVLNDYQLIISFLENFAEQGKVYVNEKYISEGTLTYYCIGENLNGNYFINVLRNSD